MDGLAIDLLLLGILWLTLACIPSGIAQLKGRGAFAFYVYGLVCFPVALVHATLMPSLRSGAVLDELRAQSALLKRLSVGIAASPPPAPAPLQPGLVVQPTPRPAVRVGDNAFLSQATALGLETGERAGRPYRVLSDGEIEVLRGDGRIDVFDSWPAFDQQRPVRTK